MVNRHRRRVAGWIAILAILLNAFAPAVSHALAVGTDAPWLEVCGDSAAAARNPGDQPVPQKAASQQHCPYCAPHGASFAAPPAAVALAPLAVAGTDPIGDHAVATQARSPWRSAHSRAPPSL